MLCENQKYILTGIHKLPTLNTDRAQHTHKGLHVVRNRKWNRTLAVRSHKLEQVRSRELGQLERSRKLGQLRRRGLLRTRKTAVDAGTLLGLQVRTFALRADLATET